ncbi:MAG: hypothetical protein JO113_00115, partial [Candidatus Eremiobacteraeota bacterium]|nr:hypothetical protein [Candidatus Eremiobacteraeota bacterium]
MSSALALREAQALAPRHRPGCATTMRTPGGGLSALFVLERHDQRCGVATYLLRVVNETGAALVCRMWVVDRRGNSLMPFPVVVEINAFSTIATQIP